MGQRAFLFAFGTLPNLPCLGDMSPKPGDFCILLRPYANDRRGVYHRLRAGYKALARLGLRVIDHRERGADGWKAGEPSKRPDPDCSACTTCAPID